MPYEHHSRHYYYEGEEDLQHNVTVSSSVKETSAETDGEGLFSMHLSMSSAIWPESLS